MYVTKGQDGGGRYTFCTYCLNKLRLPEQTVLTDLNTHANATIPPTANRFAAVPSRTSKSILARVKGDGVSTPPTKPSPSSSSSQPSPGSTQSPASYLGHHKSDESRWRDCSSLLGCTRRNRLPLGQASATAITRCAEGELPLSVMRATPTAVDIRVARCSHERRVTFRLDIRDTVSTQSLNNPVLKSILKTERGGGRNSSVSSTSSSTNSINSTSSASSITNTSSSNSSSNNNRNNSSTPLWASGIPIFPVRPKKSGWDGWSRPPPESGSTRRSSAARKAKATRTPPTGGCGGEGEGKGEGEGPPRTSKSGFFPRSLPKMAGGAMAVIGVAATVGVMFLRRRR